MTVLATGANVKSLTLNPKPGQVYALNRGPGTISMIDPVSDVATATFTADGYEDDFLTIVDGATHQSRRLTVPGVHQWESAFNERTGMLYLPSRNDNDVIVIDTASDTVSTIGTGQVPMGAAVNKATNRVYVVNYGSSDVTVIDGAVHRPIATIPVGRWPQQIAINARTNTVYVANTRADSVSVIDGRTNRATER